SKDWTLETCQFTTITWDSYMEVRTYHNGFVSGLPRIKKEYNSIWGSKIRIPVLKSIPGNYEHLIEDEHVTSSLNRQAI
ncbi:hypothetical protein A2U01_0014086, partial [Trifolium medium]|nr:hypothetical protein [Trifolium medium]